MIELGTRDAGYLSGTAVKTIVIPSQQRLLVFDMKPVLIEPDSHPAVGQSPLGINVEPLNADIAMTIDDSRELQMAENTPQVVWIDRPTEPAAQDRDRGKTIIQSIPVCPMTGRIE